MMMLVQITAPHFCAGLVLRNNVVVEAAPILSWMHGWPRERSAKYCERRGWRAKIVSRWTLS